MRKSIELGDSSAASGVAVLLWLSLSAVVFFFLGQRLARVTSYLLCVGLGWPLGLLRRRFGRRLLLVAHDNFVWLPHGRLGPATTIAVADVQSVSEWRLEPDPRSELPSWSLIFHLKSGAERRLGPASTSAVHEVVDALNEAIGLNSPSTAQLTP